MKSITIIIAVPFLVNVACSQEPLLDYMAGAAQNNPELQAAYQNYIAALQVVPQVGTLPDPKLMFGYFIEPVQTRVGPQEARVSVDQMFPWFGVLNAREQKAVAMSQAAFETFLDTKARLFYKTQSAYYQLYFLKKSIHLLDETIRLNESIKKLVQIRVVAGKTSAADEYRTEMMNNELKQHRALLSDEFELASVSFYTLLNLPEPQDILLPDSLWYTPFSIQENTLLDSVLTRNPTLKSLNHSIAALQWQQKEASRSGWPQITVGMDYIFTGNAESMVTAPEGNGRDAIIFPRIGLSLPVFRGKYNGAIDESIARQRSAEFRKQHQRNLLWEQSEKAYKKFIDAERRFALYQKQVTLAEKTFRILQTEYSTGNIRLEEILRMEQRVLEYRLNLERAKADRETAIAYINYLTAKTIGSEIYETNHK